MRKTAYFVKKPRKLSSLTRPHRIEDEMPFEIKKTVLLPQMDYVNFATDLTVDREYIEQYAHLCGIQGGVWKCLLIQQENDKTTGILVIPEDQCRIGYAAFYGCSVPELHDEIESEF